MRGEDAARQQLLACRRGSPPHARGRRITDSFVMRIRRITPACAGKTRPMRLYIALSTDHPRMRGEDRAVMVLITAFAGSPPHARGRPMAGISECETPRITPACAGKTFQHDG